MRHHRAALLDRSPQRLLRARQHRLDVGRREPQAVRLYPGETQQRLDHLLHAHGAIHGVIDILPRLAIQLIPIPLRQKIHIALDHPQRLSHVVRDDIGKLLQLLVAASQF